MSVRSYCFAAPLTARVCDYVTFRCVNAGHCHDHVVDAVKKQAETMDFAPTFQMGHPLAFEYAHRLTTEVMPNKVHISQTSKLTVILINEIHVRYRMRWIRMRWPES